MRARYSRPSTTATPPGRRTGFVLLVVALVAVAFAPTATAQAAYTPEFAVSVVSTRAEADGAVTPRLDIYTAVRHLDLRFLSRPSGFEAGYTLTIDVYAVGPRGRQGGLLMSRQSERRVRVDDYGQTQSADGVDRTVQSLPLPEGLYSLTVSVEDDASDRTASREIAAAVRAVAGVVFVTDPLLVDTYDNETLAFEPNVGATLSTEQDVVTVLYEIMAAAPTDLDVTYAVTEQNRRAERPSFGALLGLAPRQQADAGTPILHRERLTVPQGTTPATFRIETEQLSVGDYALTVRLETTDGVVVSETESPFSVRWMGLEAQIADLDEAIAQLHYVARDRDLRAMRAAATPDERLRLFQAFWSERDPSPGTPRNERMEEYYFRVAYANERYTRMRDAGWSTDRGEVYIRFGEPDDVEVHPFNFGTRPYQVWTYYRSGRRFIFVDETGGGDFELLVPIWDDRTRL